MYHHLHSSTVLLLVFLSITTVLAHTDRIYYSPRYNNVSNCIEQSTEFPRDAFTYKERRYGAVALHFIGFIYGFTVIAMVCRDFFLPSVHCICEDLKIPKDVAAATFMATATSMPEMFVNIIGTFVTESDLGVGTIVGSAVFNTLAVVGLAGLAATKVIPLDWWPLTRDCSIYLIAIGLLVSVLWDSVINWWEAVILFVFYFLYILAMFFNKRLQNFATRLIRRNAVAAECDTSTTSGSSNSTETVITIISTIEDCKSQCNGNNPLPLPLPKEELLKTLAKKRMEGNVNELQKIEEQVEEEVREEWKIISLTRFPKGTLWKKLFWFYSWPINIVLLFTIPDCRRPRFRSFYPLTFCMCIVWIGASAYFVSWMISVIGGTFRVPDSIMGLTLIAAGGDMPETISSIIMVRRGVGSMGLSNSMGANTLDILLCLGVPWLIKCFLPSNTTRTISIISQGFYINTLFLFACVILLYLTIVLFKFKMNRKLGAACITLYIIFIVFTVLVESNVFFYVNPEVCSGDS